MSYLKNQLKITFLGIENLFIEKGAMIMGSFELPEYNKPFES